MQNKTLTFSLIPAVITLFAIGSWCSTGAGQTGSEGSWITGFPGPVLEPPGRRHDPSFRFFLDAARQEGSDLVGICFYYNYAVADQTPRNAVIDGVRAVDGRFWPRVESQVANDLKGGWLTIAGRSIIGSPERVVVEPEQTYSTLCVDLNSFKKLIGTYKFGRVVLKTGEATIFELKDLSPPKTGDE